MEKNTKKRSEEQIFRKKESKENLVEHKIKKEKSEKLGKDCSHTY